jgi:hypothetical protein
MVYNTSSPEYYDMLVVESYECTRCKDGRVVFTFDPPDDSFKPAGDLVSATINSRAVLTLLWANGTRALLPDCRDRMAAVVKSAPVICVRWLSDGLIRGADLQMA